VQREFEHQSRLRANQLEIDFMNSNIRSIVCESGAFSSRRGRDAEVAFGAAGSQASVVTDAHVVLVAWLVEQSTCAWHLQVTVPVPGPVKGVTVSYGSAGIIQRNFDRVHLCLVVRLEPQLVFVESPVVRGEQDGRVSITGEEIDRTIWILDPGIANKILIQRVSEVVRGDIVVGPIKKANISIYGVF